MSGSRTPKDPGEQRAALLEREAMGDLPPILGFWGHTPKGGRPGPWVLSQWYPAAFVVDGVEYHHAEGFMMAEKARLFRDEAALVRILAAEDPADAKSLGREVRDFDDGAWSRHRYDIVVTGSVAKFSQNDDLREYLLSTAPAVLVEASPRDRIWGIGLGPGNERLQRPSAWRGQNLLGFALTYARDLI